MLPFFDGLREMSFAAVAVRLLISVLCGGIIGIGREYKRRPAGFRTHILICMGAAMTTLIGQFLLYYLRYTTDITRFGAQVIAGIGFIGAGSIIVTPHQRVKGLTTAAGLWSIAIVGLTIGSGFYELGLLGTLAILLVEEVFAKMEYRILSRNPEVIVSIEYLDSPGLETVLSYYRDKGIKILNFEVIRERGCEEHNAHAIFTLRTTGKLRAERLISDLEQLEGVLAVGEL